MLNMNATTSSESEGPLIAEQFDESLGDLPGEFGGRRTCGNEALW